MLYLNSLENIAASKTEKKYAICREKIPSMTTIPELAPSPELLGKWKSKEISWEDFREGFMNEMRAEYRKGDNSRLKRLAKYSLENDVTLHTPEPNGPQTYRAIFAEIVSGIWKREGREERVIDLALASGDGDLTAANLQMMEEIAAKCDAFSPKQKSARQRTCYVCKHLNREVYMCPVKKLVVIHYEWAEPFWAGERV
jgi:uncharacterized protein YeaO (DUF488 family)